MIYGIVAVEKANGIGFNGQMPWPFLTEDLKWFRSLTVNHIVIMGSNTWISLPAKLKDRINVVISSKEVAGADYVFPTPQIAIQQMIDLYQDRDIYIIGGQHLYNSTLDLVDKFYITEINASYPCDKHFNLDYVQQNFPSVGVHKIIAETSTTPGYIIKEYSR